MNLYVTADQVGIETGGGKVTHHESEALRELGPCEVWGREQLRCNEDPWGWDRWAASRLVEMGDFNPQLAHIYAGTFSHTVDVLKSVGCKVAYTAAAHDVTVSRKAHEELGLPYDYPHITQPELWAQYVCGYLEADVLVCPSTHSAGVMRGFGAKNRIEVIPHGVDLPKCVAPLPSRFTVGYLGAVGPDKGLIDLLRAWRRLNLPDAELVLAGGQSQSPFVQSLINHVANEQKETFTGPPIRLMGWVEDVSSFYNSISLYVQPSRTEGFGIEVLEAMAHGRAVVCSTGAGGCDVLPCDGHWQAGTVFAPGDVDGLADRMHRAKRDWDLAAIGRRNRVEAENYTWDKIRARYQQLWRSMLS